jgi:hypothetical protein
MRIRNSKPGCFVPIALALPKVHKEGTSDAQQIANPTGTRPRAANGIFSNRERQRAPVLQREDEVYNAAASRYLRQHWSEIEKMARDCLANGTVEDGQIKLVML